MGGLQSHDSAKESLLLLSSISKEIYYATLETLTQRLAKMQMQVSKWDLFMITQVAQSDIRKILIWLKSECEPTSISTHLFIVAMILTRPNLELPEKTFVLFDSLCYQCEEGQVQIDEVRFVLNLVFTVIQRATGQKLNQADYEPLWVRVFKGQEHGSLQALTVALSQHIDIQNLVHMLSTQTAPSVLIKDGDYFDENQSFSGENLKDDPYHLHDTSISKVPINMQKKKTSIQSTVTKQETFKAQNVDQPSREGSTEKDPQFQIQMKFLTKLTNDLSAQERQRAISNISGQWQCLEQKELHSMHYKVSQSQSFDSKVAQMELTDHYKAEKELFREVSLDSSINLVDETEKAVQENMKVYGSSQMVQLMINNQFLENYGNKQPGLSLSGDEPGRQNSLKNMHPISAASKKESGFDVVSEQGALSSAVNEAEQTFQFGVYFKEYFKASLQEIQLEVKQERTKLLTCLSLRGQKRNLEAKKFKNLGEIQILQTLHKKVAEMLSFSQPNFSHQTTNNPDLQKQRRDSDGEQTHIQDNSPYPQGTDMEQSSRTRGSMDQQMAATQNLVLNSNDTYALMLQEFQSLRNCGMTRKAILQLIKWKDEKRQSERMVSFWRGCCKVLQEGLATPVFSTSDFLQQFLKFAEQNQVCEELNQRKIFEQHYQRKLTVDKYNVQIGKLKAYHFVMSLKSSKAKEWLERVNSRLLKLQNRVSQTDTQLVELLSTQMHKKRANRLYFSDLGSLAAYKCITKGLAYEHSTEYLAIGLVKMRLQELVCLTCQDQRSKSTPQPAKVVQESEILGLSMTMQRLGDLEAKKDQFKQFKEELLVFGEEERLLSEAPIIPHITPLDQVNIERIPFESVNAMVSKFHLQQRCPSELLDAFRDFNQQSLQFSTYDLQGTMSYKTLDIEDAGQIVFDFVELEQDDQQQIDFIDWIGELSCALKFTYYQAQVEKLKKSKQDAHKFVKKQMTSLTFQTEANYQNSFSNTRMHIFDKFMTLLKQANRGELLNNFDCTTLSMPLEYSIINNYWFVQAMRHHLRLIEKKEKFVQVSALKQQSCVLLQQRIQEMPVATRHQPANQMESQYHGTSRHSAANTISQSNDGLDRQSVGSLFHNNNVGGQNAQDQAQANREQQERADWERQFTMCKGLDIIEETVKFELFGESQEMVEATMLQIECEQNLMAQILQTKEYTQEMPAMRADLQKRLAEAVQIEELIQDYQETRVANLDQLKKIATYGVFRGALRYVESLLESVQTESNMCLDDLGDESRVRPEETENHLECFLLYLRHIFDQVSETFEQTGQKLRTRTFPEASSYPGLQQLNRPASAALNISVKKGNLQSEAKTIKQEPAPSPTKPQKKQTRTKKKTKKLRPHQQAELNLTQFLIRKYKLIKLIQKAELVDKVETWFEWCNQEIDQLQAYNIKLESALNYLQVNSNAEPSGEYQSIQEDEIGCRMMQNVLIGACVTPVHVYNPNKMVDKKPINEDLNVNHNATGNLDDISISKKRQQVRLTKSQVANNHLLQFLNALIHTDSKLTSKQILKNDKMFAILQKLRMQVGDLDRGLRIQNNTKRAFGEWFNVYQISRNPQTHYMDQYKNLYKNVRRDALCNFFVTDKELVALQLRQIVGKQVDQLLSTEINKVDYYFTMALGTVSEADKLDFQTASVKIKKQYDQSLRTFKEMNALQENRKLAQSHFAVSENQARHLEHQIASLILLVAVIKVAKRLK